MLALDEIQKIPAWSESVKRLWDEDSAARLPLRVVLLGSAPLLAQQGLTESLAGRFELLPVPHWSLAEMRAAFGYEGCPILLIPKARPKSIEPIRKYLSAREPRKDGHQG